MKIQKGILIIITHLFCCFSCYAQYSISVQGGYTNNHLNTNITNRVFTQNKNGNGAGFAASFGYNLNTSLKFQVGIEILKKNYSFVRNGIYLGVHEVFNNTYFHLPSFVQLRMIKKYNYEIFLNAGFYGGYWAFAKVEGMTPNIFNSFDSIDGNGQSTQYIQLTSYSEKYNFNNRKDNRFEVGWLTGIVTSYNFSKKSSAFLEFRYYHALSDQQKKYMIIQTPRYNQTIFITIGYTLKLFYQNI